MECTEQIRYQVEGKRVKLARAEKGWTITKLASESGVTRKTIGEIEKGYKKKIRISTIKQIATTLEKSIDYFCISKFEDITD